MDATGARTTLHTFDSALPAAPRRRHTDVEPVRGRRRKLVRNHVQHGLTRLCPPGQIFRISPAGDFTTISSAYWLRAGVIQARDGRLYGTSSGAPWQPPCRSRYGYVFRVEANGTRTVLHRFDSPDVVSPVAELVEIDDGSLYGTTDGRLHSTGDPPRQHGTIFRVDPATGAFTTRYRFSGPDGSKPVGRLIQGTDGLIYGTTSDGGALRIRHGLLARLGRHTHDLASLCRSRWREPERRCDSGTRRPSLRDDHERRRVRLRHRVRHECHRRAHDPARFRVERWRESGQRVDSGERRRLLRRGAVGRTDRWRRDLPCASRDVTA